MCLRGRQTEEAETLGNCCYFALVSFCAAFHAFHTENTQNIFQNKFHFQVFAQNQFKHAAGRQQIIPALSSTGEYF